VQPVAQTTGGPAESGAANAALTVLDCVQRFGANQGNPVLDVLQGVPNFELNQKYPQPPLEFAAGRGRAYYHSHPLGSAAPEEHGHFHLFIRWDRGVGEDSWAHLAALAMDRDGQPLRWFATNRWVTGGTWAQRDWLLTGVDALEPEGETALLQRWLTAMLKLYRPELERLLAARDAHFADQPDTASGGAAMEDRSLYDLAQAPVDLLAKLAAQLTGNRRV
jgi:hypothetical protein